MTKKDRAFLKALCAEIEERFPNVLAAFEGFVTSYLGGEADGFLTLEVFNVPEEQRAEIRSFGESRALEHLMSGGGFVVASLWDAEETARLFSDDILKIREARAAETE